MTIIIVGNGKVGFFLAENLADENHDVTIIDNSEDALKRAEDSLDVLCIRGSGTNLGVLLEAGTERADVLISVMDSDEKNMVACTLAKGIGAKYTIARIRGADFLSNIGKYKQQFHIDMIINPEYRTAVEISQLLRFPDAHEIESFYRGRIELVSFRITEKDAIAGIPLHQVMKNLKGMPILFCSAVRGNEVFIPNGNTVLRAGDKAYVIGDAFDITKFFKYLGHFTSKVKSVFIIGGGKITYYLAGMLTKLNMSVKIVEINPDRAVFMSEEIPDAMIVNGDGTDQELLFTENLSKFEACVALTGRDEENLITSLYAMQIGVPKVVVKINREGYSEVIQRLGIDSVVNPKEVTAEDILQIVRSMQNAYGNRMVTLRRIAGGMVEVVEFHVSANTKNLNVPLKDMRVKNGILVALIIRGGKLIIPEGGSHIEVGDNVILMSQGMEILDLDDIFDGAFENAFEEIE